MKEINSRDYIIVKGARENNLKNININIPKNKLIVITGVSGSGKSSLAFDTIYAEGQRRFLESLSSYARQFLGGNEKPDVDSIEGLSPSISIDQKTTNHNPRSTVGTITEIYDYLRILYARIGTPFCPNGHGQIKSISISNIIDNILENEEGTKISILSPVISNEKGSFQNKFEEFKKKGYLRVMIDNVLYTLDDEIALDKNKKHNIDLIVDRIIINNDKDTRSRMFDSIEKATQESRGNVIIYYNDNDKKDLYSLNHSCSTCGFTIPDLEPRLFSFNSPIGACEGCNGLGFTVECDENKLLDKDLSINEGGILWFGNDINESSIDWQRLNSILKHYNIDRNTKLKNLTSEEIDLILYGTDDDIEINIISNKGISYNSVGPVEGIATLIKRRHYETDSESAREYYSKYMSSITCKKCKGKKLSEKALSVKIDKKDIVELTNLNISDCINFFLELKLDDNKKKISKLAVKEILSRLTFLDDVGLNYLTLSRTASTLSGGESQRIRLATQIGSSLTGVLYVLDEPSIGLHQKDNDQLINTLKKMRDLGNTLIVVEHDEDTMKASDWLIDIGTGAGENGGKVVAEGTPIDVTNNPKSLTGNYLSGKMKIDMPKKRRIGNGKWIEINGAEGNNLKKVNLKLPLGTFTVITGVSGSGKSTLINETLVKALDKKLNDKFIEPLKYKNDKGLENIDKVIKISQDPIGRTPRSNPATYISVFDDIRELFSLTPDAKERGYQKGRFSFNVPGGRCEKCQGDGIIKIEMHFLPTVHVKCEECNGKRYNEETLSILYKGKSIYDVLDMYVTEALEFFKNIPNIKRKLDLLNDVGLGYLKLGANAVTLSGGEAQRIKIAKYLQKRSTGKTLYVLDEPTTGLHVDDIAKLIKILNRIVDSGDTIAVIEHNLDLIKVSDYIIDLGPDGGVNGGEILYQGPFEGILNENSSYTGKYLKKIIN